VVRPVRCLTLSSLNARRITSAVTGVVDPFGQIDREYRI
jgi:hypothetical protein